MAQQEPVPAHPSFDTILRDESPDALIDTDAVGRREIGSLIRVDVSPRRLDVPGGESILVVDDHPQNLKSTGDWGHAWETLGR